VRPLGVYGGGDFDAGSVPRGAVGDERVHPAGAAFEQDGVLLLAVAPAGEGGADADADAFRPARDRRQAGIAHGQLGGCQGELGDV
jgi:hypothetical protein